MAGKSFTVTKIGDELANALEIRAALHEHDDPKLILDMIEGSTNFNEACCVVLEETLEDEAVLDGLDAMMEKLAMRKSRIERSIETRRNIILSAMEKAEVPSIKSPLGTMSVRATARKLIVVDEAKVPARYWIPSDPRLDKMALIKDLRDGQSVEGVELSNAGIALAVRIK